MAARQIYSEEINEIREIHNAIEPSRKSRNALTKQKILGVTMLIFSLVAPFILDGDPSISFFTLPMSISIIRSRKKVIW